MELEAGAAAKGAPSAGDSGEADADAADAVGAAVAGCVLTDVTPMFSDTLPGADPAPLEPGPPMVGAAESPDTLVVFGGMDLQGAMFDDCLLIRF